MADGETMRLDRFLWFARFARTRSAAQALAEKGRIRLDGRPVDRAHTGVRVGTVLAFIHGTQFRAIRIEALPLRRGPAPEAQRCYVDLTTENVPHATAMIDGGGGGA